MVKPSVVLKNRSRSPEIIKEVKERCARLKTYGYEKLKAEVRLIFGRGGYQAHVIVTGHNLRINASERRFLPLEQALYQALSKVERQLARASSKKSRRRPMLSQQAKLIQLNPYLESRRALSRKRIKAA